MKICTTIIEKNCPEVDIFESVLSLDNNNILELGCGSARLTRLIASTGENRQLTATEVDKIQHHKNLLIDDLANVTFKLGGGENIDSDDNTFDTVFMFKSLHHVPHQLMDKVLLEIKRVLKPDGLVYISEPMYQGDFNQILMLFHDEEQVRLSAFNAIKNTVDNKIFTLVDEIFFNSPTIYENFEQFEQRIINATHTEHRLAEPLYHQVKEKFNHYFQLNNGHFISPIRVDILRK